MLAGNIASINSSRQTAAAIRVAGTNRPAAPNSSIAPVKLTSNPGAGSRGGTIAIRLPRSGGTKCATPVSTNIAARPTAIALTQVST